MSSLPGNATGRKTAMKKSAKIINKKATPGVMKRGGRQQQHHHQQLLQQQARPKAEESVSSGESEMSTERTPSPTPDESISPKILDNVKEEGPGCDNVPGIGGVGLVGRGPSSTPPGVCSNSNSSNSSSNNNPNTSANTTSNTNNSVGGGGGGSAGGGGGGGGLGIGGSGGTEIAIKAESVIGSAEGGGGAGGGGGGGGGDDDDDDDEGGMDCFKDEECGPLNMSNKLGCVGVGVGGVGTGGVGGPQQQQQQQLRGNGTTNAGGVGVGGGGGSVFGAGAGSMCGATGGGGILVGDETVKPSGINERKRRASDEISLDSSTKASESGIVDDLQAVKDDDDDNDDDEDDKLPSGHDYDTERLKAFNMFVRLFVDENLDRMVPISKQPKDKIQAILEACDRQFPEFHERSRKRIRTYLKSCRRMRRSKEQNGWEPLRPTPPHLTSAAAEGILATACENESNNAKRMRMGLEPLPASAVQQMNNNNSGSGGGGGGGGGGVGVGGGSNSSSNNNNSNNNSSNNSTNNGGSVNLSSSGGGGGGGGGGNVTPSCQTPTGQNQAHALTQSSQPQSQTANIDRSAPPTGNDFIRHQPPTFRPPPEFHPPFFTNSNGIFRPGFTTSYQHPAHHHPPVIQHTPLQHNSVQNGPTDLSMKKQNSKNQLSTSEVATIKQLIAGYRESAAFLYRSADELEQLLLQQN